jgi:hypothetical protein
MSNKDGYASASAVEERRKVLQQAGLAVGIILAIVGVFLFIYGIYQKDYWTHTYYDLFGPMGDLDSETMAAKREMLAAEALLIYRIVGGAILVTVGLCLCGASSSSPTPRSETSSPGLTRAGSVSRDDDEDAESDEMDDRVEE